MHLVGFPSPRKDAKAVLREQLRKAGAFNQINVACAGLRSLILRAARESGRSDKQAPLAAALHRATEVAQVLRANGALVSLALEVDLERQQ